MLEMGRGLGIKQLQAYNWKKIEEFVAENQHYLRGDVLDFGAGLKPYEKYCERYFPYDPKYKYGGIPEKQFDAILLTQVIQYTASPKRTLKNLLSKLKPNGYLVMTYSTSWYEVDEGDTWRITKLGMERLLNKDILLHRPITQLGFEDFKMNLVYGIVCRNSNNGGR